ncbi:DUF393 domain-containing protein [bacterium]|nr:DUF393 domain-containing protein [bacterium]
MKRKLFVDKSCLMCDSFGKYIELKKGKNIKVLNIEEIEEESEIDAMVYRTDNDSYYGIEALIEVIKDIKELNYIYKVLLITPKRLRRFLYSKLSSNREIVSKLFKIIKPKS